MKTGIIGGSGLYDLKGFKFIKEIEIETKYGKPSSSFQHYVKNGKDYYFLSRHGKEHKIPPHQINYRANIDGFKQLGVTEILSFTAVGCINPNMRPGDIVISDNAFDFTNSRTSTFFEEGEDIYHIDFTEPFCPRLRQKLINLLSNSEYVFHDKGTYICTNGPRLETAAEIKVFAKWRMDIVGMTLFPEAVLAREKEICYSNISIVSNLAAGISGERLTAEEVLENMSKSADKIRYILESDMSEKETDIVCKCQNALDNNKISK